MIYGFGEAIHLWGIKGMSRQDRTKVSAGNDPVVFIGVGEVARRIGLSSRTIYKWADSGLFPKPVKLSPTRIAFIESEIQAWQEARIAERA